MKEAFEGSPAPDFRRAGAQLIAQGVSAEARG
jgi:hypothetical protein